MQLPFPEISSAEERAEIEGAARDGAEGGRRRHSNRGDEGAPDPGRPCRSVLRSVAASVRFRSKEADKGPRGSRRTTGTVIPDSDGFGLGRRIVAECYAKSEVAFERMWLNLRYSLSVFFIPVDSGNDLLFSKKQCEMF